MREEHRRIVLSGPTADKREDYTEREKIMDSWVCTICGYVYDPVAGDPDNGVAAGTAWEDVPEDWLCPICDAPKEEFEKE